MDKEIEIEKEIEKSEERICRICQESGDISDLRSPCRCRGSVQFVHQECLSTWIGPILEQRRGPPVCELCKSTITVSFRHPHEGVTSFLFSGSAPPSVARSWLSIAFLISSCFLFISRNSFTVKVFSWFCQFICVILLYLHLHRRSGGGSSPRGGASSSSGKPVERMTAILTILPALGYSMLKFFQLRNGFPSSDHWKPFGGNVIVTWRETEMLSLVGVFVFYSIAVISWSVWSAANLSIILISDSRFNPVVAWANSSERFRPWFVLFAVAASFTAFWLSPNCTSKLILFCVSIGIILILILLNVLIDSDVVTASAVLVCVFYSIVIASGFVVAFSTIFKVQPIVNQQQPSQKSLSDVIKSLRSDEINLVSSTRSSGILFSPISNLSISAIFIEGSSKPPTLDGMIHERIKVKDSLEFGCDSFVSDLGNHDLILIDEGFCDLETKEMNSIKSSSTTTTKGSGLMIGIIGRIPGTIPLTSTSAVTMAMMRSGTRIKIPMFLIPFSEAFILREFIDGGEDERFFIWKSGETRSPSSAMTRTMEMELINHVNRIFKDNHRDIPLFNLPVIVLSDGRQHQQQELNRFTEDIIESDEITRISAAIESKVGRHSDCFLGCSETVGGECLIKCSGAKSPCTLKNFCRFGEVGGCSFISTIHYAGMSIATYSLAVFASLGMICAILVIQVRDTVRMIIHGIHQLIGLRRNRHRDHHHQQNQQQQPHHHHHQPHQIADADAGVEIGDHQQQPQQPQQQQQEPVGGMANNGDENGNNPETWMVMSIFVGFVCILVNSFSTSLPIGQRIITAIVTLAIETVPIVQLVISLISKHRIWIGTGDGIIIHDFIDPILPSSSSSSSH